jgi:hypothetical protein
VTERDGGEDAAGLPADLSVVATTELREAVAKADAAENGLSYLRRLVQGRVDIVLAEDHRRRDGEPAGDVADLIRQLPTILGDHPPRAGRGRHVPPVAPDDIDPLFLGRFARLVSPDELVHLPIVEDADLGAMIGGLTDLEREISDRRRELHHLIDRVHEEIGRRYGTGEISAEDVISGAARSDGGPPD